SDEQLVHLVGLATAGVVAHDLEQAGRARLLERHHQPAAPEPGAVLAHVPALVYGAPFCQGGFDLAVRGALRPVLWREDDPAVLADDLVVLIAQEPTGAGVPAGDDA